MTTSAQRGSELLQSITSESQLPFPGFSQSDFDVFDIDGLDARMEALIHRVRPKLTELGNRLSSTLGALSGVEFFPHVAKHARRTVNPPKDTWVAFAANKRGYKAHPHFQIGLWGTHLFIQFAIIYEAEGKTAFAAKALKQLDELSAAIPGSYVWSGDHTSPEAKPQTEMEPQELGALFQRLTSVKAAEILCGIHIDRRDPLLQDGEAFVARAETVFETLMPLYKMATAL